MSKFVVYAASLVSFAGTTLPVRADSLMQAAQQTFKPIPLNGPSHEK